MLHEIHNLAGALSCGLPRSHAPEPAQRGTDPETKTASNVLIRRGNEWHGPESTIINASHIVMAEPVGQTPGSRTSSPSRRSGANRGRIHAETIDPCWAAARNFRTAPLLPQRLLKSFSSCFLSQ